MSHDKYKENIQLYILNELSEGEKIDLENHLHECNACFEEFNKLTKLHTLVTDNKPERLSDSVLDHARFELIGKLRKQNKITNQNSLLEKLKELFTINKLGLVTAALIIGFVFGQSFTPSVENNIQETDGVVNLDAINRDNISINNVRYLENGQAGEIAISFNETKPYSYQGKLDDQIIRELLALTVIKSENPGLRIQTLSTLSQQKDSAPIFDEKIKEALIFALNSDPNPGVRIESISLLKRYPYDEDIRDAFLNVLSSDDNSGVRVFAINALSEVRISGRSIDPQTQDVLNRINSDEETNNFIKLKAASILEESNN